MRALEAAGDKAFSHTRNPFSQIGAVVFFLLLTLLVTGAILFLYYSVEFAESYRSITYLNEETYIGLVARGAHRHAADLVLVCVLLHMFRSFSLKRYSEGRGWIWISGVCLLLFIILQGVTGYILPWDTRGQAILLTLMKALAALPVIGPAFDNAFLSNSAITISHVILVLGLHLVPAVAGLFLLGFHFRGINRPRVLPDKILAYAIVAGLFTAAVFVPAKSLGPADFSKTLDISKIPLDWFFAPPVLLINGVGAVGFFVVFVTILLIAGVPLLFAFKRKKEPVTIDENKCIGCGLCVEDCPYIAIGLDPMPPDHKSPWAAWADPAKCVSCGVCVGSCGFNAIDIPARPVSDIKREIEGFLANREADSKPVIAYVCKNAVTENDLKVVTPDTLIVPLVCAGQLYRGWVEDNFKSGAVGVFVVSCHENSCAGREGAKFTRERLLHERKPWLRKKFKNVNLQIFSTSRNENEGVASLAASFRENMKSGIFIDDEKPASSPFVTVLAVASFIAIFTFLSDSLWGS
ncbi:hypothetical protein MNBD_NITROSPINAE01-575 [hydrothermal vent metagenome]|uniref:Hydrogenase iron-sulfur subunit n=1 Tax=hydrothermal vent metagenome TaxID=652676 RepID=A0A3B1B9M2_9ZZZZ